MNISVAISTLALLLGSMAAHGAGDAQAGEQKAAACIACHGADGNSIAPNYPRLAGQHASYLEQSLEDYQTGARTNAIMVGFAAGLSAQDRADLAAYYARMPGLLVAPAPEPTRID